MLLEKVGFGDVVVWQRGGRRKDPSLSLDFRPAAVGRSELPLAAREME